MSDIVERLREVAFMVARVGAKPDVSEVHPSKISLAVELCQIGYLAVKSVSRDAAGRLVIELENEEPL